jgi:hypothetical protein
MLISCFVPFSVKVLPFSIASSRRCDPGISAYLLFSGISKHVVAACLYLLIDISLWQLPPMSQNRSDEVILSPSDRQMQTTRKAPSHKPVDILG